MIIETDKGCFCVRIDDTFPDMTIRYYATYPVDDFLEGYYSKIKSFEVRNKNSPAVKDVTINSDTWGTLSVGYMTGLIKIKLWGILILSEFIV